MHVRTDKNKEICKQMKEKLTKLPLELLPRMQTKFFYYRNKRLRRAVKTQFRKEERLKPTGQKADGRVKLKTALPFLP